MSIDSIGGLPVRPVKTPTPHQRDHHRFPAIQSAIQPEPTNSPASGPEQGRAGIETIAHNIAATLVEYDVMARTDPSYELEAEHLLGELSRWRASRPAADAALKQELWERVVTARAVHKQVLDGSVSAPPTSGIEASHVTYAEYLQSEVEIAETKARRAMSGPGAFKKFTEKRRELDEFLASCHAATLDDLRRLAAPETMEQGALGPSLQDATVAVTVAEAAWLAFEGRGPDRLPSTPEMDSLRVRAYRIVGLVVDDAQLEPSLRVLADRSVALDRLRTRLVDGLHCIGVTDGDPIYNARAISQQLHGR